MKIKQKKKAIKENPKKKSYFKINNALKKLSPPKNNILKF